MGLGQGRGLWVPRIAGIWALLPGRKLMKLMATYCGREGGLRLDPVHPVSPKIPYLREGVETAESRTIKAGP